MSDLEQAVADLNAWSAEDMTALPMPAEQIAALEAEGHTVNLETGNVNYAAAIRPEWDVTPAGWATMTLAEAGQI